MKGSRWFIIVILVFLLLMFILEYHLPKEFIWRPTFSQRDEQPFGCAIFDDILSASLPKGEYTVTQKTLYQLSKEDSVNKKGILIVTSSLSRMTALDVKTLLRMAERGNKIMLSSVYGFPKELEDTLGIRSSFSYFSSVEFKNYATSLVRRESVFWVGDSTLYPKQEFKFLPVICRGEFTEYTLDSIQILARKYQEEDMKGRFEGADTLMNQRSPRVLALVRPWGKGEIIMVATPLVFTNYGMLDQDNSTFVFRLLSQMKGLPIVRTEGYLAKELEEAQVSVFRYFLSQPPLRWALYLAMVTILLFMMFTAKRRQRVIPVYRDPENKSLEFTELIGTLYYQQKNYDDLVRKKFTYFAEELRRTIQVDVEDTTDDERMFSRIAQKIGIEEEEVRQFFRELRPVIAGGAYVSEASMKQYINNMNEIINHL